MECVSILAATAIAKLTFNEFVRAGETAKQIVGSALKSIEYLHDKIQSQFKGNARAEVALVEVNSKSVVTTGPQLFAK
jgi:hypothetical protein